MDEIPVPGTPAVQSTPAPVPEITLDQHSMKAARCYQEAKQNNPKAKLSLGDFAKAEGVPQRRVEYAEYILRFCPKESQAVTEGKVTLDDLEPVAQQRSKAAHRQPLQKARAIAPGVIISGPGKAITSLPTTFSVS